MSKVREEEEEKLKSKIEREVSKTFKQCEKQKKELKNVSHYGYSILLKEIDLLNESLDGWTDDLLAMKAVTYERLSMFDKAIKCYSESIHLDDYVNTTHWYDKGRLLYMTGNKIDAEGCLRECFSQCKTLRCGIIASQSVNK